MTTKTANTTKGMVEITINAGLSSSNVWATISGNPMPFTPEDGSAADVYELRDKILSEILAWQTILSTLQSTHTEALQERDRLDDL
jgi:hypothetical protein